MAPMRKVELDKAAWAWCSEVEDDNISLDNVRTAYRLNVTKCGFSQCRRNCRGNPFCLNGLGESKWMGDGVEELNDEDLDSECRRADSFVGLRNLGATCYINSLLQLWFHNIAFRNAILRWNPTEDPMESSALSHLQFLFAVMQFGRKRSVDPSDFINSLEIDASTQQDAREFSQLFISYLEDFLKRQSNPVVRDVVNNNFQGHYNYVTRCSKCKTESIRESMFYELEMNVKGHQTLDESIAEFLREEKLEGADMYSCSVCQSKQEATRHIELTALPPVFNLQLIRFIYDRQKGMKKKLNTQLQFPETLDMGPYLKKDKESPASVTYNLSVVLIHKGTSANSGHYVAMICDQTSGNWYMFNDENTQKMEGKRLKLNSDEDYEVDSSGKKQKPAKAIKGYLSSSNAYMLVYTASNSHLEKTPITEDSLQPHLKLKLDQYNQTFESIICQSREEKRSKLEDENVMKAEMASLISTLPVEEDGKWEAVSVKWLVNWISANKSTGFYPVDNHHFTCPHGNIDPGSIQHFKFINSKAADNIYFKYGGGPRLNEDSLCHECVKSICHSIRFKNKIANDQKELNNLIRIKENVELPAFWVSKESLRRWKSKALKIHDRTQVNCVKNGMDGGKTEMSPMSNDNCQQNSEELYKKSCGNGVKNEDIDNNSDCNEESATGIFNRNGMKNGDGEEEESNDRCTDRPASCDGEAGCSVKASSSPADDDKEKDGSEDDTRLNGNKSKDDEDEEFELDFNQDIVCPHGELCVEESSRRLVPEQAWKILRSYFPDCKEFPSDAEVCLDCQCLVSEGMVAKNLHKQQASKEKELLGNLYMGKSRPRPPFAGQYHVLSIPDFVEPWRKFIREPTKRDPITSLRNNTMICSHGCLKYNPQRSDDLDKFALVTDEEWEKLSTNYKVDAEIVLDFKDNGEIVSKPVVCPECVAARIAEEQQALLKYSNAKIYIRHQVDVLDESAQLVPNSNVNHENPEVKNSQPDSLIRRSQRNKKGKMEKVLRISSDQTLLCLKIEILNWLKVAPYDQHLFLESGEELIDHQATLASLGVCRDSVLILRVDEQKDESAVEEGARKGSSNEPEYGFKGTGLLKR